MLAIKIHFRHLYKTGIDTEDLERMRLVNRTDLVEQPDFEEMTEFYEHSKERHQRHNETKQQFRRRMRKVLKAARRAGFLLLHFSHLKIG